MEEDGLFSDEDFTFDEDSDLERERTDEEELLDVPRGATDRR